MPKMKLNISGMHCDHCVGAVRNAIAALPGVASCDVELGSVTVDINQTACSVSDLIAAVRNAGAFEPVGFNTCD